MSAADDVVDALAVYRLTMLVTRDHLTSPLRETWIGSRYVRGEIRERPIDRLDPPITRTEAREMSASPVFEPWQAVMEQDRGAPKLAYLVTCPWCVGVYVGVLVAGLRRLPGWRPVGEALAAGAVAAMIATVVSP